MKKSYKKLLVTYKSSKQKGCKYKVLQELKSVRKSPPAENPDHAESSQSSHNASQTDWLQQNGRPETEETSEQTKVP